MNKSHLLVVLALTCLLGLTERSGAQEANSIVVNVPFDFVAEGHALPAGTYDVSVSSTAPQRLLLHSERKGVFLLPITFDGTSTEQAKLGFEHIGDGYFLSKVETPAGVYTIRAPRPMTRLAVMKNQGILSSSGTN